MADSVQIEEEEVRVLRRGELEVPGLADGGAITRGERLPVCPHLALDQLDPARAGRSKAVVDAAALRELRHVHIDILMDGEGVVAAALRGDELKGPGRDAAEGPL